MVKKIKSLLVDKELLEKKLGELRTSGKQKLSGILNEWFDRITEDQANGYSNSDIVKKLNEAGVAITETQFRDTMFRVRRKRGLVKTDAVKRRKEPPARPEPNKGGLEGEKTGGTKPVVAANVVVLNGKEVGINALGELIRPDGMPNPAWADLQAEYRAVQRKLNRNK